MVKTREHLIPNHLAIVADGTNARKYIAIHETANRDHGANADVHARLQAGGNSRSASWHYQVDDTEAVQSYLDTTRCWHAGDSSYALDAIAIEICVNSDGDYDKALANAAELAAHLRAKHDIPWNRVISHHFITGKNCPTIMLDGRWDEFVAATDPGGSSSIETAGSKPEPESSKPSKSSGKVWPHVDVPVTDEHTTESHNAYIELFRGIDIRNSKLGMSIQKWLRGLGYYPSPYHLDGIVGPVTVKGLQQFLQSKGLYSGYNVDGVRGPATVRAEIQYLNRQRKYYV